MTEDTTVRDETFESLMMELVLHGPASLRVRRNMNGPGFEALISISLDTRNVYSVSGTDTWSALRAVQVAFAEWRRVRGK